MTSKECFAVSPVYLIPLLVSKFSSADSNILYQGKQATRSPGKPNQSCYKSVHVPPLWGQSPNTKELLNMLDTTEAAITQAYVFHEWLVDATPWTKPQIPLTTSHSIFMSWAAANRPEVEKWKKKSNNNWKGFKQWYYWEIIIINWSKKGFVFLQITLFVCSLLLEVFKRCVLSAGI